MQDTDASDAQRELQRDTHTQILHPNLQCIHECRPIGSTIGSCNPQPSSAMKSLGPTMIGCKQKECGKVELICSGHCSGHWHLIGHVGIKHTSFAQSRIQTRASRCKSHKLK
eukprot:312127-Pelagomonas_calceolata.AAC.1